MKFSGWCELGMPARDAPATDWGETRPATGGHALTSAATGLFHLRSTIHDLQSPSRSSHLGGEYFRRGRRSFRREVDRDGDPFQNYGSVLALSGVGFHGGKEVPRMTVPDGRAFRLGFRLYRADLHVSQPEIIRSGRVGTELFRPGSVFRREIIRSEPTGTEL